MMQQREHHKRDLKHLIKDRFFTVDSSGGQPEVSTASSPYISLSMFCKFVHLFVLASLAITQPLLGFLSENPAFFIAHSTTQRQLIALVVIVSLAPTAVLGAVMLVVHTISAQVGKNVFYGAMYMLACLFIVQVFDLLPWPSRAIMTASCIFAGLFMVFYSVSRLVRSAVSVLVVFPVVVVALFLFNSLADYAASSSADVKVVAFEDLLGEDSEAVLFGHDNAEVGQDASRRSISVIERLNNRFPPIYVLVFDELSWASLLDESGTVDAVRYPNFARLGATSYVFTNASTVAGSSLHAVPSLLTGIRQIQPVSMFQPYPNNLFTMLGDIYDIAAFESFGQLCPRSVCNGVPPMGIVELIAPDETRPSAHYNRSCHQREMPSPRDITSQASSGVPVMGVRGVVSCRSAQSSSSMSLLLEDAAVVLFHLVSPTEADWRLPQISRMWTNLRRGFLDPEERMSNEADRVVFVTPDDDVRVADFRTEVAAMNASALPRLSYLHSLLPHNPWRFRPDGSTYGPLIWDVLPKGWSSNEEVDVDPFIIRYLQQRYLLQLGFTDWLLGEYLDRLEAIGDFDRAIVVVTSDHGISFMNGNDMRSVSRTGLGGTAGVPLFYKKPTQKTGILQHQPVELIDVVPTIVAELGIEPPWVLEGHDMFSTSSPLAERSILSTYGPNGTVDVPEDLATLTKVHASHMHEVFGDGTSGSLYTLGGAQELIGTQAVEWTTSPSIHCWIIDQPMTIPDSNGAFGYVVGRIESSADSSITVAVSVDGIVVATTRSYIDDSIHRIHAIGDSQFWQNSMPVVELHELIDGQLASIPFC